ncbi:thioredoxin family protein [Niabella sp. 22666]|uniref:thioredoxin family protein n=1 Tax=Niabella sp. 22666 TaxID=3453954 RepID=UPI003F862449
MDIDSHDFAHAWNNTSSFGQAKGSPKAPAAMAKEIGFVQGKWQDIVALAKKEGKYIFVDAFTTWCSPCIQLQKFTFKDAAAAEYYNTHFINYTIDMEKGEGLALAEKWNINEYPTLLFFSPEGKLVKKQTGYIDGKRLIDLGTDVLTAIEKK